MQSVHMLLRNKYLRANSAILRLKGIMIVFLAGCLDGDARLANGNTSSEGRVEVCLHRTWGTVCDHLWTRREARVVCRQLMLPYTSRFSHRVINPNLVVHALYPTDGCYVFFWSSCMLSTVRIQNSLVDPKSYW